ncbi:hypothetical protein CWI39_2447p0010 [Hamiltosporidium magnivora]|uniref:Uncharacterized protein n=1 Tax=Hamiltosporidium magnivora TaxID=148818 RepID=A0A4V2JU17_9MICR|nr:hypothetical protein CWI39_2447p0010 [Hamiltosporidium magnivora]
MHVSVPIFIENEQSSISFTSTFLIFEPQNIKISFTSIKSLHTKDSTDFYCLKISSDVSYTLKFTNLHIRDFFKNLIMMNVINEKKIKSDILKSGCKGEYEIVSKYFGEDTYWQMRGKMVNEYLQNYKSENNVGSVVSMLADNEILYSCYVKMNVTLNQFNNIYKQSYFFDVRNDKNSVDRIISEILAQNEMNFSSRLNSKSVMEIGDVHELVVEEKNLEEKIVDFEPIYPFNDESTSIENQISNEFSFPKTVNLKCNLNLKIDEDKPKVSLDSKEHKELIEMCRVAFFWGENQEIRSKIIEISDEFIKRVKEKYGTEKYFVSLIPKNYLN